MSSNIEKYTIMHKGLLIFVTLSFVLVLVAGCAAPQPAPAAPVAPTAEEPAAVATEEPAAVVPTTEAPPAQEPTVLRFGHSQRPNDFNPLAVVQGIQIFIQKWTFSKLVAFDTDGMVIPDLAEEWSVSDDGKVFNFKLREGVTWQDGEPFTAEDVVFTFHYLLNPDVGARKLSNFQVIEGAEAYGAGEADTVSGIQANGELEVQFTLSEPSAVFLADLAEQSIIPKHVVEQIPPEQFATSDFVTKRPYPGTGPFTFENYVTDQYIELSANPDYFRGAPKIDAVRIESIPDANTRIIALENDEVDLIMDVPVDELARLKEMEGIQIVTHESPVVTALFVDSDQSKDDPKKVAMRQPQFRQAILHAIDFNGIIDDLMDGTVTRHNCIYVQSWACPDDLADFPFDPDKSRELLAEIGWDEDWEVDWMILASQLEPVHAVLQQMFADAGIKMAPRPVDGPTFVDNFYANGTFDVTMVGYGGGVDPHTPANNFLVCGQVYPNGFNGTRYCNDRVSELVKEGSRVTSVEDRAPIYHEIAQIVSAEMPIIPLWRGQIIVAAQDNLDLQYNQYYWDSVNEWFFNP